MDLSWKQSKEFRLSRQTRNPHFFFFDSWLYSYPHSWTFQLLLLKFGLCLLVLNWNAETEFGVKEKKNSFIALPGKGRSQQTNALKTVTPPTLEIIVRSFLVKRRNTGFQIGIRIGTNMHSFLWENLSHQSWSQESWVSWWGSSGLLPRIGTCEKGILIRD